MTPREARDVIAAFQLVPCRMVHERVESLQPAAFENDSVRAVRRPLCAAGVRGTRLACGHTNARNDAIRALSILAAANVLSVADARRFADDLARVGDAIHRIDHAKGDAEKALSLAEGGAAERVRELEAEHSACVDALRRWREDVLRVAAGA